MSFKELEIKQEYRSFQDDIINDFYYPVLNNSVKYQRAVGFFSSSALIEISKGIKGLIENGGNIQLIASPNLSEEDIYAINQGIKKREEVIEENILNAIVSPQNEDEENRIDFLVNLIAFGRLDIKIVVLEESNGIGMYHEKMGLMYDSDGNVIAFSGSMNESSTAITHNYESFDVYKSWGDESEQKRVENKRMAFSSIWNDYVPKIRVMDFPEAAKEKIFRYRKTDKIDTSKLKEEKYNNKKKNIDDGPDFPEWFTLRDYQKKAIGKWKEKSYVGIFDMATGTGKTLTGLSAVTTLYQNRKAPLAIFIVCPYQHLVTQWVEDIKEFNMKPVICFSSSPQKNWKTKLSNECFEMEMGLRDHMCAIFTNATYSRVQNIIEKVKGQAVLVVDEAHNFGAEHLSSFLDEKIPYRLALSATLERHGDDLGTAKLFSYFKEKCIEYTLGEAIANDMLVHYYYYPIVVSFDEEELDEYISISKKIGKIIAGSKDGELSESAKSLLIKRARLVSSTKEKLTALLEEIKKYKDDNHILIYCGATTMKDIDYKEGIPTESENRQINIVMKKLGLEMGMKVNKFTSEENQEKREKLKEMFDEGKNLQALIAIRCLDEGVNIPSIDKAFILASSTNPKEYIQRRGRVLRTYPGKKYAYIYDFVVSPLPLESINGYSEKVIEASKSLVYKEIVRMKDFAKLAENPSVADELIFNMINSYGIDMEEMEDAYE